MKNIKIVFTIFITIAFTSVATAQEKTNFPKNSAEYDVAVSGKIYLNWHLDFSDNDYNNNKDTFEIQRVYLTYKKKIDNLFSVRVTTDVGKTERKDIEIDLNEDGEIDEDEIFSDERKQKYDLFIKYAYIQITPEFADGIRSKIRVGMIDTPVSGYIDKISDARWIQKNFIDGSKELIGCSIDHSADLGVSVQLDIFKKITLIGAITNGEGYKQVDEDGNGNKAYYTRLTVAPIGSLYVTGFYRREGTDSGKPEDNYKGFYGGGVSWKNAAVKVGVNFIRPFFYVDGKEKKHDNGKRYDVYIVDSWLNLDLNSFIAVPLFIYGRYAIGEDDGVSKSKVTHIGAGIGYRFNKYARMIAFIESNNHESKSSGDPENTIWLKSEAKF